MGPKTEGEIHVEQGKWAAQVTEDRLSVKSVYQKATPQTELGSSKTWGWDKYHSQSTFRKLSVILLEQGW